MADEAPRAGDYVVVVRGIEIRCNSVEALDALMRRFFPEPAKETPPTLVIVPPPPIESVTEPVKSEPKLARRIVHKRCRQGCGRKAPILPNNTSAMICERCAEPGLLQQWKALERRYGKSILCWDGKETPAPEKRKPTISPINARRAAMSNALKAADAPKSAKPIAKEVRAAARASIASKFSKQFAQEQQIQDVTTDSIWTFTPTDEALPNTSGMKLRERQIALAVAAQRGCAAAIEPLLDSLKGFIYKAASKAAFHACGRDATTQDIEDVSSDMRFYVFKQLHTFDPARNVAFITWAAFQLKAAKSRYLAASRLVRTPAHVYETRGKLRAATDTLRKELGREPTEEEVAEVSGVKVEKQDAIWRNTNSGGVASLDAPIGEDGGTTRLDMQESEGSTPLESMLTAENATAIRRAIDKLSYKEQIVIRHRFGFVDGGEGDTLREVGGRLGVTRERIRQIEIKAMVKLRKLLAEFANNEDG